MELAKFNAWVREKSRRQKQLQPETPGQIAEVGSVDETVVAPSSRPTATRARTSFTAARVQLLEDHDKTRARISIGEIEEMSDARMQPVNGFSNACMRLMSKQCASDSAVLGRQTRHCSSLTSADHVASTVGVSPGRTGCVSDGNNIFSDQTDQGGEARGRGSVTDDTFSLHPLPDEAKDKKPDLEESTSQMFLQNATTKTISFHASPKKSSFPAIKAKKTVADKKPGKSLCKEKVISRIGRPRLQVSSDGKSRYAQETFKHFKVYKSSVCNQSDSSKLSEPIRSLAHKSQSGVTPPHQSKKRISFTSHTSYLKQSPEKVNTKQAIKRKTFFPHVSPSRVAKTQSSQNCYFISFNVSPRKVFCKSSDMVSSIPRLDNVVQWAGFPHRCVGYENLFKIKGGGSLNTRRALPKRKTKGKTKGKVKARGNEEVKARGNEEVKARGNEQVKARGNEEISKSKGSGKNCPDKSETESTNEGGVEDASQVREIHLASSKVSVRSVPCETHSIQNIFKNSALVFLSADKPTKKIHKDAKTVKAKPKIALFSRNLIESNKQVSDFEHFIYRQKLPSFSNYSALRSRNSAGTQLSVQPTTAQKRSNDRNMIRNSVTKGIPRYTATRNRIPSDRTIEEPFVRVKIVQKKTKSGITGSIIQKKVKSRDKPILTATNADTKMGSKDLSSAMRINILKARPQTTICHYKNKAKSERNADSDSSSDINSRTCEIGTDIADITNPKMSICSVRNAFGDKTCWDCYENTKKSLSSFFRHVSSCDGSTRREQVALLRGTFRMPPGTMSFNEHNFGIFHNRGSRNRVNMCIPNFTTSSPSIRQSRSSCCTVTFMPPLLNFLNSINKTISAPIFSRTSSENALAYPKTKTEILPTNSTIRRLPFTNNDKLSTSEVSISQKEKNKCVTHETDGELTSVSEEREKVVQNALEGDKNMADIPSELNKTLQVNGHGTHLTSVQNSERDGATQKPTTKKNMTPLSVSPTNVAKSILRMGHIFATRESQQGGRNKSFQPPSRQNLLPEKCYNGSREQPATNLLGLAPGVRQQINCKLIMLGVFCFTTILQVILYYLIPRS